MSSHGENKWAEAQPLYAKADTCSRSRTSLPKLYTPRWAHSRSSCITTNWATRAEGEQGIATFLLSDVDTAKKQVVRAWGLSKVEHDPAATVRYASAFGAGLVQIQRFKEAMTFFEPSDQRGQLASSTKGVAFPTIAVYAKIDALVDLHQYDEALGLASQSVARLDGTLYGAHKSQVFISRGSINKEKAIGRP